MQNPNKISSILIVGGGSAGWMAAAALANATKGGVSISLVESEEIGTVGVGEATIPPIKLFNQQIGIDEKTFIQRTQGTFKLGIEFVDWTHEGDRYFHPFGSHGADFDAVPLYHYWLKARAAGHDVPFDAYSMACVMARANAFSAPSQDRRLIQSTFDYAYHFDAGLYARYLREISEARGVARHEGRIVSVQRTEGGDLAGVTLEDGSKLTADFFIDCTGFRGLLIGDALGVGYEDWTHWLPCDRAVAAPCKHGGPLSPYTRSTARQAGWQWRIPLQHRVGNGYVFCSSFLDEGKAAETLLANLEGEPLAEPRVLKFKTGHRHKYWERNCVAIGLSAGFMEPLESTSLHLIQSAIMRLLALFPDKDTLKLSATEFNRLSTQEWEWIRDFLILHYTANNRQTGELWRACRQMPLPDSLTYRMEQFRKTGRLTSPGQELFLNPSWLAVLIGQGVIPERHDPLADMRGVDGIRYLEGIRRVMGEAVSTLPSHAAFIERNCAAEPVSA
jgi:tryptophan halogenase